MTSQCTKLISSLLEFTICNLKPQDPIPAQQLWN